MKTNRSLLMYLLLSVITLGIYGMFFIYDLAKDTNLACKEDGKHTTGLLGYIIFTILTAGIYSIIWWIILIDRWDTYLRLNNVSIRITGMGYFMWSFFGSLIIIGPFVALYRAIHTMNDVALVYNRAK